MTKGTLIGIVLGLLAFGIGLAFYMSWSSSQDTIKAVSAVRDQYKLPALAVEVTKGGSIRDRIAVGIRKWGDPTPVTVNDVYHIGSDTKSMTATLTAMLIEDGTLRWDTTIGEVFPELKGVMDPRYGPVTIEQLLTHQGGVPNAPPQAAWKRAWLEIGGIPQQRYEFVKSVLSEAPEAMPGTKMIYSNQGYAIVGAMLEKITGKPWETLITERLFKPLHMDSAGFGAPGTTGLVDQPWGHSRVDGVTKPLQGDNPPAAGPAGRVHCSLDDLARYAMFQMEGERSDGLLKAATMRRLHTPPAGGDYACGWIAVKRKWAGGTALTHAGSNTIFYVLLWLAPEKDFSVMVATNIAGPDAEKACDAVVGIMIKRWLEP
jgi:CubicO group peptidase (beta-lactamase class C family)